MKNTISINYDKFFLRIDAPYHAFVWLGKNFIEVAVTNEAHSKIEVVKAFTKFVGNITQAEAIAVFRLPEIAKAEKVFIGLESNKYTLLPNELYITSQVDTYLKAIFELSTTETIGTQKIKQANCQTVYSLKKGTQDLINKALRNAVLLHAPSALLLAYQQMLPPSKSVMAFIRLNTQEIFVTIYKDNELKLHQSYLIENIDDALYYFLNALQTLGYHQQKNSCLLHGNHPNIDEFLLRLKEQLPSVKFVNRIAPLQYTEGVFNRASHEFFNLFSLVLCA